MALLGLFSCVGWSHGLPPWLPTNTVTHAIHISVDGLGGIHLGKLLAKDPANCPTFRRLMAQGTFTLNARCDADVPFTEPSHVSILTGRPVMAQPTNALVSVPHGFVDNYDPGPPVTLHNWGNPDVPYKASIFDVCHDHGLTTAFFAGKDKFDLFVRSYDADNGAEDTVGADNGRNKIDHRTIIDYAAINLTMINSSNLVSRVVDLLSSNRPPEYTFLHLVDPDVYGHNFAWGSLRYEGCLRHIDLQIGRILNAIDSSPVLAGHTAIILTADHGGYWDSHSNPTWPTVFTVPLMLWGPGFPAGTDAYRWFANRVDPGTNYVNFDLQPQPLRNADTANLTLALLGLPPIEGSWLQPEFTPVPPRISISAYAGSLAVSWPVTEAIYHLQASEDHTFSVWQYVNASVVTRQDRRICVLPDAADSVRRFYRLVRDAGPVVPVGP